MSAVLISSARKTVSRSLVLVVSMGYGVVRPTLGGLTKKVARPAIHIIEVEPQICSIIAHPPIADRIWCVF